VPRRKNDTAEIEADTKALNADTKALKIGTRALNKANTAAIKAEQRMEAEQAKSPIQKPPRKKQ